MGKLFKFIGAVVFGLIVLGVIIGALGGGSSNQPDVGGSINSDSSAPASTSTTSNANTSSNPDLELLNAEAQEGKYGNKMIVGSVKNNTNKEYTYVQVEINLYDDTDAQVGSTLANANNLEPGATWKFEAPILEENATKFKVKDITGF